MELLSRSESRNSRRKPRRLAVLLSLLVVVCVSFGIIYWKLYVPSNQWIIHDSGERHKLVYQGEVWDEPALGEEEELQLPLSFIQKHVSPSALYEEASNSVIFTTADKVIHLNTDELTARINDQPYTLHFPVQKIDESVYVPAEPLNEWLGLKVELFDEVGRAAAYQSGDQLTYAAVKPKRLVGEWLARLSEDHAYVRTDASLHSSIVAQLLSDDEVIVLDSSEQAWTKVQTKQGMVGYIASDELGSTRVETVPALMAENPHQSWKPLDSSKIIATWEAVYEKNPDTKTIPEMPGLHVVSPTWFELLDGQGNIRNKADKSYVQWAHNRGYQVWGLFSNSFKPDMTHDALSTYETRMAMIRQLVSFAELYQLQGINIDFENVYLQDKDLLTQFMREMTPLLHEQGLTVSIDVTIRGGSPMWSLFYDREELGKLVDYMMVMTYDEHWASSPVAGSVASLPWTERGIKDIIVHDKVPPEKLLLGIPYYTRLWTEVTKDGKTEVSSKAIGMETAQQWLKDRGLTPELDPESGQHYAEYKDNDTVYKIWLEDELSIQARAAIVKKYNLAGVASWRRGFEAERIWEVLRDALN